MSPPLQGTDTIAGLDAPISYGEATLVGGTVTEVAIVGHVPGVPPLFVVQLTRRVLGANRGNLSFVFDGAAATLQINSDDALDDGVVAWTVYGR